MKIDYRVPATFEFADNMNTQIERWQQMTFDALYEQDRVSYGTGTGQQGSDPNIGKSFGGIDWINMTQIQCLAIEELQAHGKTTDNAAEIFASLGDPADAQWNGSYAFFGLVPGVAANASLGEKMVLALHDIKAGDRGPAFTTVL